MNIFRFNLYKNSPRKAATPSLEKCLEPLGIKTGGPSTLPFANGDATTGCENELQTAVRGSASSVDLPVVISESSFMRNIWQRSRTGDTSKDLHQRLVSWLEENPGLIWENSWVRLPLSTLHTKARRLIGNDILEEQGDKSKEVRSDANRFFFKKDGEEWIRVPSSYMLKLALFDSLYSYHSDRNVGIAEEVFAVGEDLADHLLNDNTSPEITSFYITRLTPSQCNGRAVARETAKRYLFVQLLNAYANTKLGLIKSGQESLIFQSPHPPVRLRMLNDCISDSFYRELFMNPCLSGWENGQEKLRYMNLCHQVLSRSHLNTIMKLRDASILTNNLVMLPNTSNISLANNGTHISIGSKKLSQLMKEAHGAFDAKHEKYLGDLVCKIFEHFIPLFIGTYSCSPYRFDFHEFHPEKVLGFLPHELDFTHLRMLWRRWKKKTRNVRFRHVFTPFGPSLLDRSVAALLGLKGDYLRDYRLIDYPVALLSTETSPALDGSAGNDRKLIEDLHSLGIFHKDMSLYLPTRLRTQNSHGFSGFEARYYSLFPRFLGDLDRAVDLQLLLLILCYKLISKGLVSHQSIPDHPFAESERRQIIFAAAVGLPTFYMKKDTPNKFIRTIVSQISSCRQSRRYPSFVRVKTHRFLLALTEFIKKEAQDVVEMMNFSDTLEDLKERIMDPNYFDAAERITARVLEKCGVTNVFTVSAGIFNENLEKYCINELRESHVEEGWRVLKEDLELVIRKNGLTRFPQAIDKLCMGRDVGDFLSDLSKKVKNRTASPYELSRCLKLAIITIKAGNTLNNESKEYGSSSVCRA